MLRFLLATCLLSAFNCVYAAQDQVAIPALTQRVVDLTDTLGTDQRALLEGRLREFESSKGSQIAVLIVPTTQPETIDQYALRIAEQWKLGRKNVDDGALLLIAKNDRALRIEVGYGLEGALNDATSKRIISEIITPRFKEGDFYAGILDGVEAMIKVIDGEPLPVPRITRAGWSALSQYFPFLIVLVFALGSALRAMLGRVAGAVLTGGVIGVATWLVAGLMSVAVGAAAIGFLFTLMTGQMRPTGLWSSRHGQGGFDGGFRGGDFGGGGGTFGGGGASGRW